jgi:hypothetical protein
MVPSACNLILPLKSPAGKFILHLNASFMKKNFILAGLVFLFACNSNQTKETTTTELAPSASVDAAKLVYPYPVNYDNFKLDDQKNTEVVLKIWKLWDDGDLTSQKQYWADSAEVHTWDGLYIKGSRDSISASGSRYRSNFKSITSSVSGVVSFTIRNKASNQDENWASVWGKRVSVEKNGKADSVFLHEAWKLNSAGKGEILFQFAAKITQ